MTLEEARAFVRANQRSGTKCPCCDQYVKLYRRTLNGTMLYALSIIYRYGGSDWLHVPSFLSREATGQMAVAVRGGDWAKLKYWRFIEEKDIIRDDGSNRSGYWRITDDGVAFLREEFTTPSAVFIYNDKLVGFDEQKFVSAGDIKHKHFNFRELMA